MTMYVAPDKNVRVFGQAVRTYVEGVGERFRERSLAILGKHGIKDLDDKKEYSLQAFLDALKELNGILGNHIVYKIGSYAPSVAVFPPDIKSIEMALGIIDTAYHMNHSQGEIGKYAFELTGENSGKMVCDNPFPCDFDRGLIEAMAKKFKPNARVTTRCVDCRKEGGEECTYIIEW